MALQFTEEEIDNEIVNPIFDLVNQALSGADNATVDMVVKKIQDGATKLNSNEVLDVAKIVKAPLTIGKAIASKTPTKKDDKAFGVLDIIYNICFGEGGGLFALLSLPSKISGVKKAE